MVFTTPGDGKMRKDRQGYMGEGGRWTEQAIKSGQLCIIILLIMYRKNDRLSLLTKNSNDYYY